MDFMFDDLTPREVPVLVGQDRFVLVEATSEAASKWRNYAVRGAKMVDGKVVGIGDIADAEPLLVSLCLYQLADVPAANGMSRCISQNVGTGTVVWGHLRLRPVSSVDLTLVPNNDFLVPMSRVKGWRSSIVSKLFAEVKRMSGLDEQEETLSVLEGRVSETLDKIRRLREEGDPAKNSPSDTTVT